MALLDEVIAANKKELRKLVLSIKANPHELNLLLAVCDDRNLQETLTEAYERELKAVGFQSFRTRLNMKQPSLRATLDGLVEREAVLTAPDEAAVVTVLDASYLLGVTLDGDKSEQDRFFFSLQWTREALRQFEFPVVLWLSDTVATRLGQRAPDFWSWRRGVFEFESQSEAVTAVAPFVQSSRESVAEPDRASALSIADLRQQVEALESTSLESSLLITSYNALGEAYEHTHAYGEALVHYQKALDLARKKNNLAGQGRALINLGNSLRYSGRPEPAIEFYEQGLEIYQEIGDRKGEANSLGNLGNAYYSLGQYQRAIDFQQQSLEIKREIGDRNGEANSLGNLGSAYGSLGQYQRAIDFQQQSLEIKREIGDRNGEANSLGNLGNAYYSLGQYQRAIDFQQQSLEIAREIGDRQGEADSLGNLGNAYRSLGQYQRAIDFQQQSLEIRREIGDRNGEATSLFNKAIAPAETDRKREARLCYEEAKQLYKALALEKDAESCDEAIADLGKKIVAIPNQVPAIEKMMPSAATLKRRKKRAIAICFLIGLGTALFIWWIMTHP